MIKLISSIIKEFHMLRRDKAALATLFLMPVLLVFVITFLQDATISQFQKTRIPIIFINEDTGELAQSIENGLKAADYFELLSQYNGKKISDSLAYKLVAEGVYKVFIKIPTGISRVLDEDAINLYRQKVSPVVQEQKTGIELSTQNISVFFDPTIQKLFKTSILDALEKSIEKVKSKILLKTFSQEIINDVNQLSGGMIAIGTDSINLTQNDLDLVKIDQQFARKDKIIVMPNSVQHNVPAWSMFAMFFIALPLAGNMIREREAGSLKRLLSMPISYGTILSAKIIIYIGIAFIQFILMMLVGLIFLPLLGTPVLTLGETYLGLILLVISSALAATGFGILVGVAATSHEQASAFSSVSIIIAAALGGVMVPVYLMPAIMQNISVYSPLAWGLNGFLDIFVRGSKLWAVIPNVLRLLLFSATALVISSFLFKFKNQKI
ncbi:MAG: ABC transporter permease [Calditrichaceae bacterium]|nr:ABC transporter permease [Calditrichaceae bacterium]HES59709.1 ABC transporter permease [Caldithrix sp.]